MICRGEVSQCVCLVRADLRVLDETCLLRSVMSVEQSALNKFSMYSVSSSDFGSLLLYGATACMAIQISAKQPQLDACYCAAAVQYTLNPASQSAVATSHEGKMPRGHLQDGINAIEVCSLLRIRLAALQEQRQALPHGTLVDVKLPRLQPLQHPVEHLGPAHQLLGHLHACRCSGNPSLTRLSLKRRNTGYRLPAAWCTPNTHIRPTVGP